MHSQCSQLHVRSPSKTKRSRFEKRKEKKQPHPRPAEAKETEECILLQVALSYIALALYPSTDASVPGHIRVDLGKWELEKLLLGGLLERAPAPGFNVALQ
jgi:hypothetical protein